IVHPSNTIVSGTSVDNVCKQRVPQHLYLFKTNQYSNPGRMEPMVLHWSCGTTIQISQLPFNSTSLQYHSKWYFCGQCFANSVFLSICICLKPTNIQILDEWSPWYCIG